jgi:signal transduction histidine kinase
VEGTVGAPAERSKIAVASDASLEALTEELARERDERRRAECTARIQSDAVQLALDLLVREPNIGGFFRVFTKTLVEESESYDCEVWLLDETESSCELWMAFLQDQFFAKESTNWEALPVPRESMAAHLLSDKAGWTHTAEYRGGDARLPEAVREFNQSAGVDSMIVAPLALPTRNLGWIALLSGTASECEATWRRVLLEATARQATLALHQSRLAEQSRVEERRQAVLEERNRLARDIHDTLAQGFGAILMQLQAAQRAAGVLAPAVASSLETAIDLARTHMVEARRSVAALRPNVTSEGEDVAAALDRITRLVQRTTDVPIHLTVETLPDFGAGVEREIIGIAQEAITNAVRHARARRIAVHASGVRSVGFRLSVADDGRGIAKERRDTGFGMTSMQERAERIGASLTIVTAPRSGTEVVLAWEPASFSIPRPAHVAQ